MCNEEIRIIMKQEQIFMWQIAQILSLHETTVIKYFRVEMSAERKEQVMSAIETIRKQRMLHKE